MPTSSMQPTAVANALKGEKSFNRVEFPITGDNETDLISGIRTLLENSGCGARVEARVLHYLYERSYGVVMALEEDRQKARTQYEAMKQAAAPEKSLLGSLGQAMSDMRYPQHSPGSSAMPDDGGVSELLSKAMGVNRVP